ncbi:hypothetical protein [Salmonella enterica]|uniref:hypothetical protein n=1 Tax=Salmonella enterica TaxID=28901 RepID=UPI0020CB438E|nr:hypothetical protein [Salmonella enterica]
MPCAVAGSGQNPAQGGVSGNFDRGFTAKFVFNGFNADCSEIKDQLLCGIVIGGELREIAEAIQAIFDITWCCAVEKNLSTPPIKSSITCCAFSSVSSKM